MGLFMFLLDPRDPIFLWNRKLVHAGGNLQLLPLADPADRFLEGGG